LFSTTQDKECGILFLLPMVLSGGRHDQRWLTLRKQRVLLSINTSVYCVFVSKPSNEFVFRTPKAPKSPQFGLRSDPAVNA
jgi:hypothetical protein